MRKLNKRRKFKLDVTIWFDDDIQEWAFEVDGGIYLPSKIRCAEHWPILCKAIERYFQSLELEVDGE